MLSRNGYEIASELDAFITQLQQDASAVAPATLSTAQHEEIRQLVALSAGLAPSADFAAHLQRRLLRLHPQSTLLLSEQRPRSRPERRPTMFKRPVLTLAAALTFLALLFAALFLLRGSSPAVRQVSAAELLSQANEALSLQPSDDQLLYDRLVLNWDVSGNRREDVMGQLWQTADGATVRYQLIGAEGELLYFFQRRGGTVWRSVHTRPVGLETVSELLVIDDADAAPPTSDDLIPGDLSIGWPAMQELLAQRQRSCLDLYCLLGLTPEQMAERARVTDNGNDSHFLVEINGADSPSSFTLAVAIDRRTYVLEEIVQTDRGRPIAGLRHVERRLLEASDVPAEFFEQAPASVSIVNLVGEGNEAPGAPARDRVWLISVSPEAGSNLQGPTTFEIVVGYDLVSQPAATLQVNLARPGFGDDDSGGRLPIITGNRVEVTSDNNEVTVSFSLDPDAELAWMGPGELAPWILLGSFQGAMSLETLAAEHFTDTAWTIGP